MNRSLALASTLLLFTGSLVSLTGCPGEIENVGAFACDVEGRLFPGTCTSSGCHGANDPAAGLDLHSGNLKTRLASMQATESCPGPLLVPGKPDESVLYRRLTDAFCGDFRMPFGKDPLSDHDIACVRTWIEDMGGGTGGSGAGVVANPASE